MGMHWHWLDHFLDGTVVMPVSDIHLSTEIALMLVATAIALTGIYVAWLKYKKRSELALEDKDIKNGVHITMLNKYWFDEIYDSIIRKPIDAMSNFLGKVFDPKILDGIVNGFGIATQGAGEKLRLMHSGKLYFYILVMIFSLIGLLMVI